MANVCVITGGGSGMGLEAAKFMPKDKIIVLSGRTMSKLEKGVEELKALGFEVYAKTCDTSSRASVKELVAFCANLGEVKNVINSAGVSPAMKGTPEGILRINALGTTVVVVTHEKSLVNRFEKRVIMINEGNVVTDSARSYEVHEVQNEA
jgi:short-subunit dehydrogenase